MRTGGYLPPLEVGCRGLRGEMEDGGVREVDKGYQPKGGRKLCNWA